MKRAISNGDLIFPTPGARGICPSCEGSVRAFCGQQQEWHWRHIPAVSDCPMSVIAADCFDARALPVDEKNLDAMGWPAWLGHGEYGRAERYDGWAVVPASELDGRELCEWDHAIITGQGETTYVVIFDRQAAQRLETAMGYANATLERADSTIRRDSATGKLVTSF